MKGGGDEGFNQFLAYLQQTLSDEDKIKLKMLNPLGIALKIAREHGDQASLKLEILAQDKVALAHVDDQIKLFSADTESEFTRHIDRIENQLLQLQLRGEVYLDETMRLVRIRKMLDSKGMRKSFEEQVIADSPGEDRRAHPGNHRLVRRA